MKKTLNHTVIPWFLLVISLVLGYFCASATEFTWSLTIALSVIFVLTVLYRNNFGKAPVAIARTLLGAVFVFSGFVKGVDPLGTQYQIFDYFAAYNVLWANPFAKMMAIGLITAEMIVGIALILNIRIPFTVWITALMMVFFTVTTLLDATIYSDKISDCGCFGKAVKLTNWQTFYKNIVLDIWVVILFFGRYRIRNTFSLKNEFIITAFATILFFGFQIYNLRHLPVIEFLDWKAGVKLNPPKTLPVTIIFQYKNNATQEIHEFEVTNLPADLSANWTFVGRIDHDPNPPNLMIPIYESRGNDAFDVADFIAGHPGYTFIVAIHDLGKTKNRNMDKILDLLDFADRNEHEFMFLFDLNVTDDSIEKFKQRAGRRDFNIYFSDDKSIKAIVRSNPGLILLQDGYVRKKWAWRDIPSPERMRKIIK